MHQLLETRLDLIETGMTNMQNRMDSMRTSMSKTERMVEKLLHRKGKPKDVGSSSDESHMLGTESGMT